MVSSATNQNFTAASPQRPKSKFKKFLGVCGWFLVVVYFLFMGSLLAVRYLLFPYLDSEKPLIEQKVSQLIGVPVSIGSIKADWYYLNPAINLKDIKVGNNNELQVQEATAALSFSTIIRLRPVFEKLSVINPTFTIKRTAPYHYEILGKEVNLEGSAGKTSSAPSDLSALNWLFSQKYIEVSNGYFQINNQDSSGPFIVKDISLVSHNTPFTKQVAVDFTPPEKFATPVSIKGELSPSNPLALTDVSHWDGKFYLHSDKVNFAEIADFVPSTNIQYQGFGGGSIWLDTKGWIPSSATFIGSMSAVKVTLGEKLEPLSVNYYKGKINASKDGNNYKVATDDLSLQLASGVVIDNLNSEFGLKLNNENKVEAANFKANQLDLTSIAKCFPSLPIPADIKDLIIKRRLNGTLSNLDVKFAGDPENIDSYSGTVGFKNLSCESYVPADASEQWYPGFKNLTGSVTVNKAAGEITLDSQNTILEIPKIFPVTKYPIDKLQVHGTWNLNKPLTINVDKLVLESEDAALTGSGSYRDDGSELGFLQAHADISRGKAESAWKYVPWIAGEGAVSWVRYGIVSGKASNGTFDWNGPIDQFPFKGSPNYKFAVVANISDIVVDFYPLKFSDPKKEDKPGGIWPTVGGVNGVISFIGEGMHVDVKGGHYKNVNILGGTVDIPSWYADPVGITVDASAQGPLETFIEYANISPVKGYTADFFGKSKVSGNGKLNLAISVPFSGNSGVKVKGAYAVNGANINVNQFQIPDLTNVVGKVTFSEKGAEGKGLTAKSFGQTINASFSVGEKGAVNFNASGVAAASAIQQAVLVDFIKGIAKNYLSGSTPFTLKGSVVGTKVNLEASASLLGMASKLPAPLTKEASTKQQLNFSVAVDKNSSDTTFNLEGTGTGRIIIRNGQIERATIGKTKAPELPARGFAINYDTPVLSLTDWGKVLDNITPKSSKASSGTLYIPTLDSINLIIGDLKMEGLEQKNFALSGNYSATGWNAQVSSDQVNGTVSWKNAADKSGTNSLDITLSNLHIPESLGSAAEKSNPVDMPGGWPAINATITNFSYGAKKLGNIEMVARPMPSNKGHFWKIQKLLVKNPDFTLNGSGSWLKGYKGENQTTLIVDNAVTNLGNMIQRFGMGKVVKGGKGHIKGDVSWDGSPLSFNLDNFDGHLEISFGKGEILKVEPGAASKLVNLLSLQSLTKYLTLDFRDFYSKGFNFDSIIGETIIDDGIMQIKDLTTVGSGATVVMNGKVNLRKETQDLNILVLPDINSTGASIALAVANPIAGIGSFIAQLVLKDPLSKMFSFQYSVTGTWSDPIVKKIEKKQPHVETTNDND